MCALDRLHDRNYRNFTIVDGVRTVPTRSCSERVSNPRFRCREAGALTRNAKGNSPLERLFLRSGEWGLHTALTGIHICYTYMKCLIVSWSSATGCYYSTAFLCSCQSKMAAAQSCHGCNCCYGAFYWVSPLGLLYSLTGVLLHHK